MANVQDQTPRYGCGVWSRRLPPCPLVVARQLPQIGEYGAHSPGDDSIARERTRNWLWQMLDSCFCLVVCLSRCMVRAFMRGPDTATHRLLHPVIQLFFSHETLLRVPLFSSSFFLSPLWQLSAREGHLMRIVALFYISTK